MNHDSRIMPHSPNKEKDEDDWETAEMSFPTHAKPGGSRPTQLASAQNPMLRPSAPAFTPSPRPTAPTIARNPGQVSRGLYNPNSTAGPAPSGEEDEWFGVKRPVTNRQLWDSANNAAPPTIIQPSALQSGPPAPVMQILRRDPASGSGGKRTQGGGPGKKTIEERAEEYRLARERIFGSTEPDSAEDISRGGSGSGGKRGGKKTTGGGSGKSSPGPTAISGAVVGAGPSSFEDGLRLVPTQIKRSSPSGSPVPGLIPPGQTERRSGSSTPRVVQPAQGVLRQPRGPADGGGFVR